MERKSKQRFRKKTIKSFVLYTCVFLFILPLLVSWGALTIYSNHLSVISAIENRKAYVELIGDVVEKELTQLNTDINALAGNEKICDILTNTDFHNYGSKLMYDFKYLDNVILNTLGTNRNVERVIIINNQGDIYSNQYISQKSKSTLLEQPWYQETLDLRGRTNFIGRTYNENQEPTFSVARMVIDKNLQVVGVIHISYDQDFLLTAWDEDPNKSSEVYLVSEEMEILFSSDSGSETDIRNQLEKNQEELQKKGYLQKNVQDLSRLLIVSSPNIYGLRIINSVDYTSVKNSGAAIQLSLVLITLICIIIFAVCIRRFYREFSIPIHKVLNYIRRNTAGQEDPLSNQQHSYELTRLNNDVIALVERQQQDEREIQVLTYEYEQAALEKLQAQMNPHFLYNTLTTVKFVALQHGETEIAELITALVKLMRSLINRSGTFVSVTEELNNLTCYFRIERSVYRNQFEVNMQVQKGLGEYLIPSFILQPLAENCIFHGIEPNKHGGVIQISCTSDGSFLYFTIQDNGQGMSPAILNEILQQEGKMTNFGISGVRKKLNLLFPEIKQPLEIISAEGQGTLIKLTLPLIREANT